MFITSWAAIAAASLLGAEVTPGQMEVAPSYGKALQLAAEQKKPIAVFIGSDALSHLSAKDGLTTEGLKTLQTSYIAVKVDIATADGKKLADAFGFTEGVVISDNSGAKQALRHEGKVETAELSTYIVQYAQVSTVSTTDYRGLARRPVLNAVQNFNTAVFGQPLMRSTCPNCR